MKTLWTLTLVASGLVAAQAAGQTGSPAPSADAKKIEALVQQLGSSRYIEREDAQRDLEKIGAPALEYLRKAAKSDDAEISRRAADMIQRVEEKLKIDSVLAPKMVKLSLKDVSVLDALEELKLQSGYDVQLEANRDVLAKRKITLETGDVSYFEALAQLCAKAGLGERLQPTMMPFGNPGFNPGVNQAFIRPRRPLDPKKAKAYEKGKVHEIGTGVEYSNRLTNADAMDPVRQGMRSKVFEVKMVKGKSYTIDMESSELDSYLRLEDRNGRQLAQDDDGGGYPDARIRFTATEDATYRVITTTFAPGATGNFVLRVHPD